MIKWGIPFFVNVMAGDGSPRVKQEKDIIPPQAPIVSALPEATNSSLLLIEGYTEPNAALDFLINDQISLTAKANDDGSFASTATLELGTNRVQVRAADAAGNINVSEVKMVVFDSKPLDLTVSSPKDGSEFFGKNNQVVDIQGEVSKPETQIIINNSFVIVEKDGTFIHRLQLEPGTNDINVVASDKAGNTAEDTISLVYTP